MSSDWSALNFMLFCFCFVPGRTVSWSCGSTCKTAWWTEAMFGGWLGLGEPTAQTHHTTSPHHCHTHICWLYQSKDQCQSKHTKQVSPNGSIRNLYSFCFVFSTTIKIWSLWIFQHFMKNYSKNNCYYNIIWRGSVDHF